MKYNKDLFKGFFIFVFIILCINTVVKERVVKRQFNLIEMQQELIKIQRKSIYNLNDFIDSINNAKYLKYDTSFQNQKIR